MAVANLASWRKGSKAVVSALTIGLLSAVAGCTPASTSSTKSYGADGVPSRDDGVVDVVTTTPIVTDLARNVAGNRARVTGLIPSNADPHTHELTLRDVRNIANADVAFSNGLLLEPQPVLRSLHNSSLPGTPVVSVAEKASTQGATVIPLVENLALDTVWLGLRSLSKSDDRGAMGESETSDASGEDSAAPGNGEVQLAVTNVEGPGNAAAYVTGTFGEPEIFFNSGDGFDSSRGFEGDATTLPVDAHTHMSWAFSEPGVYRVHFKASAQDGGGDLPHTVAEQTVTFAVGVAPDEAARPIVEKGKEPEFLDHGHVDVAVNLGKKSISLRGDRKDSPADRAVVVVPPKALQQIPPSPQYRFLGNPGSETYMLPQAVLGKHVHGELDPHLWHNARNAMAMVKVIRDELIAVDPEGTREYRRNADNYLGRLRKADENMQRAVDGIPQEQRQLVTAHDGYAYLSDAYGMKIGGFVSPNPAVEPSARDVIALTRTLENLKVPAVFLEPSLAGQARDLKRIAENLGIRVCTIRGDAFDPEVNSYEELMQANAKNLSECLGTRKDDR